MSALTLRPAAAAEVEDAYSWYEEKHPGLGEEFLLALRAVLEDIRENPQRYPVLHRDIRRALLRRFPYGVHYRLLPGRIVVVACFHSHRDPRRWRSRS